MQSDEDFQSCAARLKALADADRLRIVGCLLVEAKSVSALADALDAPIEKVSHHLGVLRAAQLVKTRRAGKFVIYSLAPDIAATSTRDLVSTIDLGCCQLDLVQPTVAAKRSRNVKRKK